jgi:hypothetical protein
MTPTKRHWQQIAAELRLETESKKILSLSLELESALEKDGISQEDDSRYSPRTQARAKWGLGPQGMDVNLKRN